MSEWFIIGSNQIFGPYSPTQMRQLAASGSITPTSQVRLGRDGKVILAKKVQGLFEPTPAPEPVTAAVAVATPPIVDQEIEVEEDSDWVEDSPEESEEFERERKQHFQELLAKYSDQPSKTSSAFVGIGSILGLGFLLINVFGGIVSGIWLAFLGEWRLIIGGFAASMAMPTGYTIAALPTMLLGAGMIATGVPPKRWAIIVLGIPVLLWSAAIMVGWTLLVFFAYMKHAEPGHTIPLLLWGYSTTMSPLKYMASGEQRLELEQGQRPNPLNATNLGLWLVILSYIALVVLYLASAEKMTMYIVVGTLGVIQAAILTATALADSK